MKNIIKSFLFVSFLLEEKNIKETIPKGSTYTKMLPVVGTGDGIYFVYCFAMLGL